MQILLLTLTGNVVPVRVVYKSLIPHPGGIGGIFTGPNLDTVVKGPDGSVITYGNEGGASISGSTLPLIEVNGVVPAASRIDNDSSGTKSLTPTSHLGLTEHIAATSYPSSLQLAPASLKSASIGERVLAGSSRPSDYLGEQIPGVLINPTVQPIQYASPILPLGPSTIVVESVTPIAPGKVLCE